MPELPEVENYRRFLEATALDRRIAGIEVAEPRILKGVSERELAGRLKGHVLTEAIRHGKNLFARIDGKQPAGLILHFGMTGYLRFAERGQERHCFYDTPRRPFVRFKVLFEDGAWLGLDDMRLFGRVLWTDDFGRYLHEKRLGPDALTLTEKEFAAILARNRLPAKNALMDQSNLAGVGNVYADEILYRSKIHPLKPLGKLSKKEQQALYRQIGGVLAQAVAVNADYDRLPEDYLIPHRTRRGKCPLHHTAWETIRVGGRTTYFCPRCQPL